MKAMLKVMAEAKEVEKAEVDEVTERQKHDAEPKWCLHVMEADAAKMESLTVEAAMLLLLLMLLRLWTWSLKWLSA